MNNMEHYYNCDKSNPNILSQWYPKIKDVPGLKTPETITIPVPIEVFSIFENDGVERDILEIRAFVEKSIAPFMATAPEWFIKNGCFSNKFDFRNSITNERKVLDDFIAIQYASVCLGTGGASEINLRTVIPWDRRKIATIYNGMPLRTEIRVFYDFDCHEVLYSANYWDYDYVRPKLRERTDIIVFDAMRREIIDGYQQNRERVERVVADALYEIEMAGKWSIDILVGQGDTLWLIDMAQAELSAYWKCPGIR